MYIEKLSVKKVKIYIVLLNLLRFFFNSEKFNREHLRSYTILNDLRRIPTDVYILYCHYIMFIYVNKNTVFATPLQI